MLPLLLLVRTPNLPPRTSIPDVPLIVTALNDPSVIPSAPEPLVISSSNDPPATSILPAPLALSVLKMPPLTPMFSTSLVLRTSNEPPRTSICEPLPVAVNVLKAPPRTSICEPLPVDVSVLNDPPLTSICASLREFLIFASAMSASVSDTMRLFIATSPVVSILLVFVIVRVSASSVISLPLVLWMLPSIVSGLWLMSETMPLERTAPETVMPRVSSPKFSTATLPAELTASTISTAPWTFFWLRIEMSPEPEFVAEITLTWVSRTLSLPMPPTARRTTLEAMMLLIGSVPVASGSLSSMIAPLESSETEPVAPVFISAPR